MNWAESVNSAALALVCCSGCSGQGVNFSSLGQVMTMRCKRSFLVLSAFLLGLLTFVSGCGSSINNPKPQGGFTNANLNGTFAISFSGTDANGFFAVVGTLTADGNGHITSGVLDLNDSQGPANNVSFSGTYTVRADGRGVAALASGAGNFSLVFVITSPGRALITRFEQSATGSGSMDLQNSSAFSTSALAGTFVFNLVGPLDATGSPESTVGSFTTDNTGSITGGVQDSSENGAIFTNEAISGTSIQVAANGRGTASLSTAAGPRNFAFYVVDANRIKLVETDSLPKLAGDAFRQSGTISNSSLAGPFAFTVAGNDVGIGPFAGGGVLTSDGAGNITTGTEDFNEAGSTSVNIGLSGTYTVSANGRGTAVINSGTTGMLNLVLYPTTNGVQLLETDTGTVVSGTAFAQSGALSSGTLQGTYGLNYTGVSSGGELDAVASLTSNGAGHVTGIIDINNVGSTSSGTSLTASYSVDSTGRGPLTLQSGLGQQNTAVYVLNGSRALFVDLDSDLVAVGIIEHQ